MLRRQELVLASVVLLALSAAVAAGDCAAEPECLADCTDAYANSASDFPYSVDYTTTQDNETETFVWKVCSLPCKSVDPFCRPLASLQLRLADALLANPSALNETPVGQLSNTCDPAPGWLLNSTDLKSLATTDPATNKTCELFILKLARGPQLTSLGLARGKELLDRICQQDVLVLEQGGSVLTDQHDYGPSCLYVAKLGSGASGSGLVLQKGDRLDVTYRVDSLVANDQYCDDFWALSAQRPNGTSPNAAYRLALRGLVEEAARSVGDFRRPAVRAMSNLCASADSSAGAGAGGSSASKRLRTTVTVSVRAGLEEAYLTRLRAAVEEGVFLEDAAALGCPEDWLPAPMRYRGGAQAVCRVDGGSQGCTQAPWDPSEAQPL